MLTVITIMLVVLAALNAIFTTWATVIDARRASALMRALGARVPQVSSGLVVAQVLAALPGAIVGIPLGILLFHAPVKDGSLPPVPWIACAAPGALLAMAALTVIPAWVGARQPAARGPPGRGGLRLAPLAAGAAGLAARRSGRVRAGPPDIEMLLHQVAEQVQTPLGAAGNDTAEATPSVSARYAARVPSSSRFRAPSCPSRRPARSRRLSGRGGSRSRTARAAAASSRRGRLWPVEQAESPPGLPAALDAVGVRDHPAEQLEAATDAEQRLAAPRAR